MNGTYLARIAVIGALTLTACGGTSDAATSTTLTPPPEAPRVDLASLPEWFVDEDAAPSSLVATVGDELGAEYVGSMAVEWPTGGLGCSSGGYDLQVITPGYVIFYRSEGTLVRVHASESGLWKQCELGRALEGIPTVTS